MSETTDDWNARAADYVLGVSDNAERAALEAAIADDPAIGREVAAWQERLAPLAALAAPVQPPPELWERLAAATAIPHRLRATGVRRRISGSVAFWRAATAAGFALAAAIAGLAFVRSPPPQTFAALVPIGSTPAAFVASVWPSGRLQLTSLQNVPLPPGDDLELWALPPGSSRPLSLGVVGRGTPPMLPGAPDRTRLLISREPAGGSPTGQPTGPVMFAGSLHDTR